MVFIVVSITPLTCSFRWLVLFWPIQSDDITVDSVAFYSAGFEPASVDLSVTIASLGHKDIAFAIPHTDMLLQQNARDTGNNTDHAATAQSHSAGSADMRKTHKKMISGSADLTYSVGAVVSKGNSNLQGSSHGLMHREPQAVPPKHACKGK